MSHTAWYIARSSGFVAWILLAAAMLWGLLLATRVFGRNPGPKWLTDLHRFLGALAVVFTMIHIGALVADNYTHFGLKEVLVPMASSWEPVAVAAGVVAFWILLAVEISSLLMKRLPRRVWHAIHLTSFVLFLSATAHAFAAGTDAGNTIFQMVCVAFSAVILLLAMARLATRKAKRPAARELSPSVPGGSAAR